MARGTLLLLIVALLAPWEGTSAIPASTFSGDVDGLESVTAYRQAIDEKEDGLLVKHRVLQSDAEIEAEIEEILGLRARAGYPLFRAEPYRSTARSLRPPNPHRLDSHGRADQKARARDGCGRRTEG